MNRNETKRNEVIVNTIVKIEGKCLVFGDSLQVLSFLRTTVDSMVR